MPGESRAPGDAPKGYNGASTDEGLIRHWWHRYPEANIGLAAGHVFWALDIDGHTGEESLMALCDRFGDLPDTLTQFTGGGGAHLLFNAVDGLKNWAKRFNLGKAAAAALGFECHDDGMATVPGIDIITSGKGIISSPSVHESGRRYHWKEGHGPKALLSGKIKIADAPQWLIDIATPPPARVIHFKARPQDGRVPAFVHGALNGQNGSCSKIINAPDGQQSFTLYQQSWAIGGFVGAGLLGEDAAFDALYAAGLQMPSYNPKRPWRAREIESTIRRGLKLGATQPRFLSGAGG